jgi:hypothetical protein
MTMVPDVQQTQSHGPLTTLQPRDAGGHQFLCYGDSCSGVPDTLHAANLALVNAVASRLSPPPEFVAFLGDEIAGLTRDIASLRNQWHNWLNREMSWITKSTIPLYHVASNHTTYDEASEKVFREVLSHLPRNGPPGQEGLTYYVRRGNLLLVFINTSNASAGGDGWAESEWLERILSEHHDAPYKFVFGHQPAYPVNGCSGECMRELAPEAARLLWQCLVRHRVVAYICSHLLAFDVQVHQGVLQILSAGSGTAHLLPNEYLHCVQMAIDAKALRYQVIDTTGTVREWLNWPPHLPPARTWSEPRTESSLVPDGKLDTADVAHIFAFEISGRLSDEPIASAQTLLAICDDGPSLPRLWIGLRGPNQQLCVVLAPLVGRSPQIWRGPKMAVGERFSVQVALHTRMGPGGILFRFADGDAWSSFMSSAQWGAERVGSPTRWTVGRDLDGRPFQGTELSVRHHSQLLERELC